jgi:hypothetical protein
MKIVLKSSLNRSFVINWRKKPHVLPLYGRWFMMSWDISLHDHWYRRDDFRGEIYMTHHGDFRQTMQGRILFSGENPEEANIPTVLVSAVSLTPRNRLCKLSNWIYSPILSLNCLFKGIASRDWGGLQMVLLDRFFKKNSKHLRTA